MSAAIESGSVLGRYVLREPLGRGGMGTVWRAEHATLGTQVAVKLMAAAIAANDEMIVRFRREARLAASLDSPFVVRVLDFDVALGTPYLAMELLQGETLAARLSRKRRLSYADTRRIVANVARGIGTAHAAHIVHRDLKPENIFLVRSDDGEVAKVLDFGVAKSVLQPDALTRTGAVVGTLQYMAPEQLEGRRGVDLRADLWSLAIIVFECVCGVPAFHAGGLTELVRAVCIDPLPIPSKVASVSAAFDAWFARAAHRDPSKRFERARAMADALATTLDVDPPASASIASMKARETRATAKTELALRQGGSPQAGYEIAPDVARRIVRMRFWGLWDLDVAKGFRTQALEAYDELRGAPWVALSDSRQYLPQKPEVQEVHGELMGLAMKRGLTRVAVVVNGALSQMQIRRLFEESGGKPNLRFFQDEGVAKEWLTAPNIEG